MGDSATKPPVFLSVGHSTRHLHDFTWLLLWAGVRHLCDVRRLPSSARCPWFGGPALRVAMHAVRVGYSHAPELGGLRHVPAGDAVARDVEGLGEQWRGYAAHMLTVGFEQAFSRLWRLGLQRGRVAVMCAEREPGHCHRALLCDALVLRGARVYHLLEPGHHEPHRLHAQACVGPDGHIHYPPLQGSLF